MKTTILLRSWVLVTALVSLVGLAQAKEKSGQDGSRIEIGKKGLRFATTGGDFKLRLGGRLQIDGALHDEDRSTLEDGSEVRRARIYLKGSMFDRWSFKAQADFSDGDADLKDLYLRHTGRKGTEITIGNFKEPFAMEEQISSKHITFVERSLPIAAFAPGRAVGLGIHHGNQHGGASVGLFGEAISGHNSFDDQGFGIAARFTRSPFVGKSKVLHLGFATAYREPRRGQRLRFDAAPESSVAGEELVRTRRLNDVQATVSYGLEAAWRAGSVSLQGEYIGVEVNRNDGKSDVSLSGWYTYLSWFPTADRRPYDAAEGVFGQVKPKHKGGAWELAVRFSTLDLDGPGADGGQQDNITLATSWYPNTNLRLMLNYVMVDSTRRGRDDNPNILLARAQVVF